MATVAFLTLLCAAGRVAGQAGTDRWIMTGGIILVAGCYLVTAAGLTGVRAPARALLIVTGLAGIGPRVVALSEQVRRQRNPVGGHRASAQDIAEVLGRHRRRGQPLEAAPAHLVQARIARDWDPDDPLLAVSLAALARQAGAGRITPGHLPALRPLITSTMHEVGVEKPWGQDAEAVPPADGGEAIPWTLPLHEREVRDLTSFAGTACLLAVATVTGMRKAS